MNESVIIIGASHAAAEAVTTLRRKGWTGKIILVGDEQLLPYQRPPLSKAYYKGEVDAQKLLIKAEHIYEKAEVEMHLGVRATKIDATKQTVDLDNGIQLKFTKLIIATGTRARKLPIEGADLPQIHYLRTLNDVDKIKQKVKKGSRLLIVGAGYIGLEVAASAVKQGVEVTVLEAADRVLARVTSPQVSDFYQTVHAEEGVKIRLNTQLQKFVGNANDVKAVLANGEEIPFDCAIVGIGVIPNTELAESAGLKCDNGIVVDEYTQTSDPNIYAVGDVSNHPSFVYKRRIRLESVPNANEQAKVASLNINGEKQIYDQIPWFWSDQYDIKLQTVGLLTGYDQVIVRHVSGERKLTAFYLLENKLIAVDAINSPADFMVSKKLINQNLSQQLHLLSDENISIKEIAKAVL